MKTIKRISKITVVVFVAVSMFSADLRFAEAAPACPLSGGANSTVINFGGTTLFGNRTPHQKIKNVNIPAGQYSVKAVTWDNHSAHGGQNQRQEKVKFVFKSGGVLDQTGATTDIPENKNQQRTDLGNIRLNKDANKVVAEHAAYPGASSPESVTPLCIKLTRLDSPTPTPTPDPTLTASCSASPSIVDENDTVTWDADASGGNGSYTYSWGGDVSGNSKVETESYSSEGTKTATVTVQSGSQSATATCNVVVEEDPDTDFDVTCRVSDTRIDEDARVTFTADVEGGNSPFTYDWHGDHKGEDRDDDQIRVRYTREGRYDVSVTVEDDDGNRVTDSCPVVRVEEEDDDLEVTCRVSDTRIEEGDRVTFTADARGGNSPYDYDWDGDISGDDRTERVRFNRDGRYEVEVTVRDDDGNRDSDTCPVVRVSDDGNGGGINITTTRTTPSGEVAGLSSVFLGQVPVTGVSDVLKTFGFIVLVLLWSVLVVYFLRRNKNTKTVSSKIENFKEANRKARRV